jgi:hypothetical protein
MKTAFSSRSRPNPPNSSDTSVSRPIDQVEPISCLRRASVVSIVKSVDAKEIAVSANDHGDEITNERLTKSDHLGRISLDWWATIVAGIVVLLAVAGLLPKIPW